MVTIEYIADAAMRAYHDKQTEISRATLEALGICVPKHRAPIMQLDTCEWDTRYDDLLECFHNPESYMDRV